MKYSINEQNKKLILTSFCTIKELKELLNKLIQIYPDFDNWQIISEAEFKTIPQTPIEPLIKNKLEK
jgi:hypothetical protein